MFATPMWGWLVDKYIQPEIVNPIGHLTIAASLLLIGKINLHFSYFNIPIFVRWFSLIIGRFFDKVVVPCK